MEGMGERYLERKINAAPEQLEKLAKKQLKSSRDHGKVAQASDSISRDGRDREIERLRKELAAAKIDKTRPEVGSRPPRSVYSSGALTAKDQTQKPVDKGNRSLPKHEDSGPASISQGELNRLALQHAGEHWMPLKASNLERLTAEQHILDKDNKHGGSAALLHSSRAQHGSREKLACSSLDAQGNHCTEPFRPHRTSDLCIVEVVEEKDQPERAGKARNDTKQKQSGHRKRESIPTRKEHGAIQLSHADRRKVYQIR